MGMKIHVISETSFLVKGTGVHTAFLNHINLLREKNDVEVIVNGEGKGDVFHSHTYFLYYFWKGREYKGRRVFTAHVFPDSIKGAFPVWQLFMPIVRWGLRKAYSYADVCIAISPTVEEEIVKSGARTKIARIFNPIDVDAWKRSDERRLKGRQMLGLNDNDFVVLGVGQVMGGKGVEDFLDVAGKVPEAKFVWTGGRPWGVMTEGLVRINRRLRKAGPHVILTGQLNLEQMPLIYAASDLMIFPSFRENCPLAPLEAAASGIPVIYRDLEEYRLLYHNPYLKAGSTAEFIDLIKRMMNDKQFYQEGLEKSKQLLKQFDKNVIRDELILLYKNLMKG